MQINSASRSTVSVIFTNYNYRHFLYRSLNSLLKQTRIPDEIIIIDDASTDGSVDLIQELITGHSHIQFHANKKNIGLFQNVETALKLTTKKFIYFMSSDDYLDLTFFEKILGLIEKFDLSACFSLPIFVKDNKNHYGGIKMQDHQIFYPNDFANLIKNTGLWICGNAVVVNKELFLAFEGIDEKLGIHCDLFINHCIAFNCKTGLYNEHLAYLNIHENSLSSKILKDKKALYKIYPFFLKKINSCSKSTKKLFIDSQFFLLLPKFFIDFVKYRPIYWDYYFAIKKQKNKTKSINLFNKIKNKIKAFIKQSFKYY